MKSSWYTRPSSTQGLERVASLLWVVHTPRNGETCLLPSPWNRSSWGETKLSCVLLSWTSGMFLLFNNCLKCRSFLSGSLDHVEAQNIEKAISWPWAASPPSPCLQGYSKFCLWTCLVGVQFMPFILCLFKVYNKAFSASTQFYSSMPVATF